VNIGDARLPGPWRRRRRAASGDYPGSGGDLEPARAAGRGRDRHRGRVAGIFLQDARPRLSALEEAVQNDDTPAVERLAHTLKGSSGNMGARGMSALCARLEDAGASGDLSQSFRLLERLKEEFGRVDRAFEDEIHGN
jgi:HPt (histidine-containing phosphotransfer) domain-containing protein